MAYRMFLWLNQMLNENECTRLIETHRYWQSFKQIQNTDSLLCSTMHWVISSIVGFKTTRAYARASHFTACFALQPHRVRAHSLLAFKVLREQSPLVAGHWDCKSDMHYLSVRNCGPAVLHCNPGKSDATWELDHFACCQLIRCWAAAMKLIPLIVPKAIYITLKGCVVALSGRATRAHSIAWIATTL